MISLTDLSEKPKLKCHIAYSGQMTVNPANIIPIIQKTGRQISLMHFRKENVKKSRQMLGNSLIEPLF